MLEVLGPMEIQSVEIKRKGTVYFLLNLGLIGRQLEVVCPEDSVLVLYSWPQTTALGTPPSMSLSDGPAYASDKTQRFSIIPLHAQLVPALSWPLLPAPPLPPPGLCSCPSASPVAPRPTPLQTQNTGHRMKQKQLMERSAVWLNFVSSNYSHVFSILKEHLAIDTCSTWNLFAGQEGRNRGAGVENGHVGTGWEGWGGMRWELRTDVYTRHA